MQGCFAFVRRLFVSHSVAQSKFSPTLSLHRIYVAALDKLSQDSLLYACVCVLLACGKIKYHADFGIFLGKFMNNNLLYETVSFSTVQFNFIVVFWNLTVHFYQTTKLSQHVCDKLWEKNAWVVRRLNDWQMHKYVYAYVWNWKVKFVWMIFQKNASNACFCVIKYWRIADIDWGLQITSNSLW